MPIIVKFCQNQVPYNYTTYPNYIGHFSQLEAEEVINTRKAQRKTRTSFAHIRMRIKLIQIKIGKKHDTFVCLLRKKITNSLTITISQTQK